MEISYTWLCRQQGCSGDSLKKNGRVSHNFSGYDKPEEEFFPENALCACTDPAKGNCFVPLLVHTPGEIVTVS